MRRVFLRSRARRPRFVSVWVFATHSARCFTTPRSASWGLARSASGPPPHRAREECRTGSPRCLSEYVREGLQAPPYCLRLGVVSPGGELTGSLHRMSVVRVVHGRPQIREIGRSGPVLGPMRTPCRKTSESSLAPTTPRALGNATGHGAGRAPGSSHRPRRTPRSARALGPGPLLLPSPSLPPLTSPGHLPPPTTPPRLRSAAATPQQSPTHERRLGNPRADADRARARASRHGPGPARRSSRAGLAAAPQQHLGPHSEASAMDFCSLAVHRGPSLVGVPRRRHVRRAHMGTAAPSHADAVQRLASPPCLRERHP